MNLTCLPPQFCIVEYRTKQSDSLEPKAKHVILVALFHLDEEDDRCKLRLFVDPHWREFVQEEDRNYVESLLRDFVGRAEQDPEMLFQHICTLGAGPLVAAEAGTGFSDSPSRLTLIERLVQL